MSNVWVGMSLLPHIPWLVGDVPAALQPTTAMAWHDTVALPPQDHVPLGRWVGDGAGVRATLTPLSLPTG